MEREDFLEEEIIPTEAPTQPPIEEPEYISEHRVCYWDDVNKVQAERNATEEEVAEILAQREAAVNYKYVPQSVTRRKARQALLLNGLLSQVPTLINAIEDETQRGLAQIEWEDSLTFERQRPLVIVIGTALGLDSEELDALFIQAEQL